MHINDSNATERLSEKTDHGSMRFGHIQMRQKSSLQLELSANDTEPPRYLSST